jgi:hypothetical protein
VIPRLEPSKSQRAIGIHGAKRKEALLFFGGLTLLFYLRALNHFFSICFANSFTWIILGTKSKTFLLMMNSYFDTMSQEEFDRGVEDGEAEKAFREDRGLVAPFLEVLGGTHYNPPDDPEDKEKYDEGFKEGYEG